MSNEFSVGDRVRISTMPPYVKTAEPKPMLRPPNVVQLGEEGVVVDHRPGGFWAVRFTKGMFLLDSQYLEPVTHVAVAVEAGGLGVLEGDMDVGEDVS